MSGGSVGPLLIPANYVGCLSANQMTGTFLLCPAHHTPEQGALHQSIGLVCPNTALLGIGISPCRARAQKTLREGFVY